MKSKLLKVWFFILLFLVIFHSSITVIYNTPITPFKEKYVKAIDAYMNPLFSQTWTLFAPNPVNTNINIEVKFSYENNEESNWINFTNLVNDQKQDSFLTHYHFYSGALTQMQGSVIETSNSIWRKLQEEEKNEVLDKLDKKNFNKYKSEYIEGLVNKEDIHEFLKGNTVVNSLYGLIYIYFDKYYHSITDMQVRVSSEYFPEYGVNEESKYQFYYLPKIRIDQLVNGG